MTAAALAVAWGCLAAIPCARAARSQVGKARVIGLGRHVVEPPSSRAGLPGWLERSAHSWTARRTAARERAAVVSELAVTIDLLAVAVGAGYTPYLAVAVAAQWAPPVLGRMLDGVAGACRLGSDFDRALDDMARTHEELRGLADALLATDRLGAPVLDSLQRLAVSARADVRRRAEAQARTVPVRLLFPLVFLVLPAFGILTVVPTVAERLGG
jgi:pilus assembly protein TadC